MDEIRRRFEFNTHLARHLAELSHLTNRTVTSSDLIGLDETDRIREESKKVQRVPTQKLVLPFSQRSGKRIETLRKAIYARHSGAVYLWTEYANVCGMLKLSSILEFNFDFDFDIDRNGVFTLQTEDLNQKLLLDFGEVNGQQTLEVELSGSAWGALVW